MKKQFTLSIATPCAENWDNFMPTKEGAYCKSCNKNVMDFRAKTDEEIQQFFQQNPEHVCGRFHQHQLKAYATESAPTILRPGYSLLKAGVVSLFMLLLHRIGSAQELNPSAKPETVQTEHKKDEKALVRESGQVIKGIVMDEDNELIPGVNVYLKGTDIGTITDINGAYEFPTAVSKGDVLCFSFIGFETLEYKIKDEKQIEVNMHMMYYDIMGEVAVNEIYTHSSSGLNRFWNKVKEIF